MINSPNHPMPNLTSAPRRSNEQARFLAAKAVRDLHGLYLVVWIVWIHVVVFVLLIAYKTPFLFIAAELYLSCRYRI